MSTATASVSSPRASWGSRPPSRSHQLAAAAMPTSRSPGGANFKGQSTSSRVPNASRSPSPNYFGFVSESHEPTESDAGLYARKNWVTPSMRSVSAAAPPRIPIDQRPEFDAFRRQAEKNIFNLNLSGLSQFTVSRFVRASVDKGSNADMSQMKMPGSSVRNSTKDCADDQTRGTDHILDVRRSRRSCDQDSRNCASPFPTILEISSNRSQKSQLSYSPAMDDRLPRLSVPTDLSSRPLPTPPYRPQRSDTLPASTDKSGPSMMLPQDIAKILQSAPKEVLLLDLRVNPHYAHSRIKHALNLCIPTTLLKRPSFDLQKLTETFSGEKEKTKFSQWRSYKYIIVYDACSRQLKDATSCINTLKKFAHEGYKGQMAVVRGGVAEFSKQFPALMDQHSLNRPPSSAGKQTLAIDTPAQGVIGGCPMPSAKFPANPFFNNIRQNMDLIGGVGQLPIKRPVGMSKRVENCLPVWLRQVSDSKDNGKLASDRFLKIEQDEQKRMEQAYSLNLKPEPGAPKPFQIAGIEKGSKNRYPNIFPYDHSRVRLQDVPAGACDYFNANAIKAEWSHKHYIATQAPIPATFDDFWRVVWEQDARVIVMLTAEVEGNQIKSHRYWKPGDYGPLKLKLCSEKKLILQPLAGNPISGIAHAKRVLGQRRSTNPNCMMERAQAENNPTSADGEIPHAILRTFTLSHSGCPYAPFREITQLQYTNWPDFGAPASPAQVLSLVEHCNNIIKNTSSTTSTPPQSDLDPEPDGGRPVLVHCSAGCGRTGAFCTVDTVIDMLKRQRIERMKRADRQDDHMDVDSKEDWINKDDIDLVAKTVDDFRHQRLSMVQTLRQFVLCYEAVMEWYVGQLPPQIRTGLSKEEARRSYQG